MSGRGGRGVVGHRAAHRSSLITRRPHRAEPRPVRLGPSALSRRAGDSGPVLLHQLLPGALDLRDYDGQDRLTWAGSTGTAPCTGQQVSSGTLSQAEYQQSFGYDAMGRLSSGPGGSYSYGDPAHVHAATAIGSSWSGSYDAAGNL